MKKIYYILFLVTGVPGVVWLFALNWKIALAVVLVVTGNNFLQETNNL